MAALALTRREARLEARLLYGHALGVAPAWFLAHGDAAADGDGAAQFEALLARRLEGQPVAWLLGEAGFYGLRFSVGPAVLIPRPETELLVELALARLPADRPARVLDLGTGSGAIAVALAVHRPVAAVTGVDRSPDALALATANAARLAPGRIRFLAGRWLVPVAGERFDCIVSNPPYVRDDDPHLEGPGVRFEPRMALTAGPDGLDDLRQIIAAAPDHLADGGWLLLEHGYDQQAQVMQLAAAAGLTEVRGHADLSGIPRAVSARLKLDAAPAGS